MHLFLHVHGTETAVECSEFLGAFLSIFMHCKLLQLFITKAVLTYFCQEINMGSGHMAEIGAKIQIGAAAPCTDDDCGELQIYPYLNEIHQETAEI